MFEMTVTAKAAVFLNTKTQKSESLALLDVVSTDNAIKALTSEAKAATSASAAAVSLLTLMLKDARVDAYKGKTPIRENIPKEFKSAVRDLEVAYLRGPFVDVIMRKVADDAPDEVKRKQAAHAEEQFQQWCSAALRTGGAYAQAKSKVLALYAQVGKLPEVFTGEGEDIKVHLLSVAAIEKLLQNAREADQREKDKNEGISAKLVSLNVDLNARSERTKLGSYPEAIRALRAMLETFEKLEQEQAEQRTQAGAGKVGDTQATPEQSVADAAQAAILAAQKQTEAAPF